MRGLIAIFFVILYSIALLKPVEPLLEYYLRYDLFSKKLCLNLDRPELKCNGKCILMQRLKAAQENESKPITANSSNINLKEYPVGFMSTLSLPFKNFILVSTITAFVTSRMATVILDIFHPPS